MEIPAKTADILRPHRSSCEITCKELLQKFHTNSITRSTILVKIFGILWVLRVKHFLHILHTLRTSTLFRGGGVEKNLIKAVFMSVCRSLAVNSIEKHVKKGVPKPFGQDCR